MFGNSLQDAAFNDRLVSIEKRLSALENKADRTMVVMLNMKNVHESAPVDSMYGRVENLRKIDIRDVMQMVLDHLKLEFHVEPATNEKISLEKIGKRQV